MSDSTPVVPEVVPNGKAMTLAQTRRAEFLEAAVPGKEFARLKEAHDIFFGCMNDSTLDTTTRTVLTARAVVELSAAMGGKILDRVIMPLMNTPTGFDTDKNPMKAKQGKTVVPYGKEIVLGCAVQAWVVGLPLVGNLWNIIGQRMYARKEGFQYLLATECKWSVAVALPPIPASVFDQGGYANCVVKIQYRLTGDAADDDARRFQGEYRVKINRYGSVEQTEGKATRKGLRDLWAGVSGQLLQDGEVGEESVPSMFQVGAAHSTVESRAAGIVADSNPSTEETEKMSPEQVGIIAKAVEEHETMSFAQLAEAVGMTGRGTMEWPASIFEQAQKFLAQT